MFKKKMRSKNPLEDGELGVFNKNHVHLCSKKIKSSF